jgi:hypothetical protein
MQSRDSDPRETGGAETDAAETDGAETDGAETGGAETGSAETEQAGPAEAAPASPDSEESRPARTMLSRRALLIGGAAAVAAGGATAVWGLRGAGTDEILVAAPIDGPLPVTDPDHAAWGGAREARVALIPQQIALPWLDEATLDRLSARALFNGQDLGLLLEWEDDEPDEQDSIATFRDAVAVMLPSEPGEGEPPPIFMGAEGRPVYIAQWRASWQTDLEQGFQDVGDVFPGWYSDVHPRHETLRELGLEGDAALAYSPGLFVGNPLSQQERISPVEELAAGGFGTLTHLPEQRARGRGLRRDGRWRVAIEIPAGGTAPEFAAGQRLPVAFAVWDGGRGQVGSRKQYADWIELVLPGGA